jgi:hypothetical protein
LVLSAGGSEIRPYRGLLAQREDASCTRTQSGDASRTPSTFVQKHNKLRNQLIFVALSKQTSNERG